MGLIETEGLILKSYSLAEADKIIVFLTQSQGTVRGVAKGAKRLKSKFGGSLEPFSIVQLTYFQKEERELVSIRECELVKSYFESASDPVFLQKFAYIAELLNEFAPPNDPNERLYRMVKVCLETASELKGNLESVVLYFEFWLLRLGGYLPDWSRCDNCKRELEAGEKANLQINFHLLCAVCSKARSKWIITPLQREIFITAQKVSPLKFADLTKDQTIDVREISSVLKKLISNILGREVVGEKTLVVNS
ncbi:MAG: recO [Acidobacteria bacterium]|jgi:DNA repair protein RecO (recombination protein O)|nr:recO [Acidobacteriota bacterium]